ncbi:MAG: hypothetical protein IPK44_11950 [Candidatus Accumulibacter sp.]|uniref:hypothetical protein n=1 Tax=Accumulibacter sp. TaxID=2053492 RepID=UPI002587E576|nr:hypothetical protein [Accumulibacter sp.]MBK8115196.1 hypothetical protein [Accumulibacter sp.]
MSGDGKKVNGLVHTDRKAVRASHRPRRDLCQIGLLPNSGWLKERRSLFRAQRDRKSTPVGETSLPGVSRQAT